VHVDTEKSEQLVNRRMAYVAVSRARHDAHIYTNDKSQLARQLGRDNVRHTAIEQSRSQEPEGFKLTPSSTAVKEQTKSQSRLQSQGQGIGR